MAGVKISALPAVPSAPLLADIFPEVQPASGGTTYKTTFQQLLTLFQANLSLPFLPLAGGTMSGIINMGSNKITTMTDPTLPQDAATKAYVDSVAQGLNIIGAVRVASTAPLTVTYVNGASGLGATLTNAGTQAALVIDGVTMAVTNRVLIKDQTSTFQNGVYTVTNIGSGATNWILTRSLDYDQASEIQPGDLVVVNLGTVNANTSWLETATVTTIGTDPILFTQFTANPSTFAKAGANNDITSMSGLTGKLEKPTAIADTSGNNVLAFTYIPSAVNYINITNNIAGQNPIISAGGASAAVAMLLLSKSGLFEFSDSAATASGMLQIQNAAGNHFTQLTVATAQSTDLTLTLPAVDGTNASLWSNGSGILSLGTYANANITSMTGLTGNLKAPTGILDSNNKTMLSFVSNASAVNYLGVTNQITGSGSFGPSIFSQGTDSIVPIQFQTKSADLLLTDQLAAIAPGIRFYNAASTFYTKLQGTIGQSSSVTFTLPVADGVANAPLQTNASGVLSFGGTWSAFTPAVTGWSATASAIGRYILIGKLATVAIQLQGTSNATTFTMTNLPATAASNGMSPTFVAFGVNAGVDVVTVAQITASSTIISFFNGITAGVWTATGTKSVTMTFQYETA